MVCCTNNTANIILFSTVFVVVVVASIYILMGRRRVQNKVEMCQEKTALATKDSNKKVLVF